MPREGVERRRDRPGYDPAETSMIRKAARVEFGNPLIDALVRALIMVMVGGGAGYVSNQHQNAEDAQHYERLAELKNEFEKFRQAYDDRQRERTSLSQREREELLQRLTALETRLQLLSTARR